MRFLPLYVLSERAVVSVTAENVSSERASVVVCLAICLQIRALVSVFESYLS